MAPTPNESVDLVSPNIIKLLEDLLKKENIINFKIKVEAGSIKGDNYLGVIAKVQVNGISNITGDKVNCDYIVKSAPKNEVFRSLAPIRLAYEREIYIYNVVLPEFFKFQEERGVQEPFNSVCKCLSSSLEDKDEALIMKDMKSLGYIMKNRHEPLDYEHTKLVLKEYAKLHAFSFALREQKPELLKKLAENCEENFMTKFNKEDMQKNSKANYEQALKAFDPIKDKEAYEKLTNLRDNFVDIFTDIINPKLAGEYAVIGHGDSWVNNMLFKYNDPLHSDIPTNLCILDWQLARFGSPALDLSYFLYTCTDKQLRDEHFDDLLQIYHKTLGEFLKELGSDIEKLFPYEVLQKHFTQFGIFGLIMAIMVIRLMTSEVEEIPDIAEVCESKNYDAFCYESKNSSKYYTRIRDVVYHCIKNGTI